MKTKSVHFHVLRNSSFAANATIMTFEIERLNVGGGMNFKSGIFTVPVSGTYHFEFSGLKSDDNACLSVSLEVNRKNVHFSYVGNSTQPIFMPISFSSSLQLKVGDKVNLFKGVCGSLRDSNNYFTHFSGWLVEEDLVLV